MVEAITRAAEATANVLRERGWRLCSAESCTGGGIAHALTAIPGSSHWFECGWVTYSNESKARLLGVPSQLIQRWGAVSSEVAAAMASGALSHSAADVAIAVTGIAGPGGGSAAKPVGLVWFGWATRNGGCRTAEQRFAGDRAQVRQAAVLWGLRQLLAHELGPDSRLSP